MDKDTILCCSFSQRAGSFGCYVHNKVYKDLGLNYVYKSFSVEDIGEAIQAMRTLNIRGAGISMPYKVKVLDYVDVLSEEVKKIGSANTVVNDGKLTAHNTDWLAAKTMLRDPVVILGNGGYAKAVAYAAEKYRLITRDNWGEIGRIRNSVVFNCTPVKTEVDKSNVYIDSSLESDTGKELALIQASHQFELYTGISHDSFYQCFHNRPEAS